MASIFTKIIQRTLPAHIVAEDEHHIAFLDIRPIALGHTLVVPKQATDVFFELEDAALSSLMLFAKKVAKALQQTIPCLRVGVAVVGLEVPHAHLHLVPLNGPHDIDFKAAKLTLTEEALQKTATQIRAAVVL
ncbi:MAG: HIT family protein [Bacteroidota bacterium]